MITCTPDALAENARCWTLYPPPVQKAILIKLLCAAANGETIESCSVESLANDSLVTCLASNLPLPLLDAISISLCCNIVSGGGFAGINTNLDGLVDPTGSVVDPPPNPSTTWTYTNVITRTFWVWPKNSASWEQIV